MQNSSATNRLQRLFESGLVYLEQEDTTPVEIKRGMTIQTQDGEKVGRVAAVVFSDDCKNITHLLLTLWSQPSDYRLVPVDLIKHIREEAILLHINRNEIKNLPHRQEKHL